MNSLRRITNRMNMNDATITPEKGNDWVRVQIPRTQVLEFLKAGLICTSDMRCLGCDSKNCLWKLVLKASAYRMGRS